MNLWRIIENISSVYLFFDTEIPFVSFFHIGTVYMYTPRSQFITHTTNYSVTNKLGNVY